MVDVFIYKALTVLMAYMELILWMKFRICNQQHYYMVQSSSSVKIAAYLCSICMHTFKKGCSHNMASVSRASLNQQGCDAWVLK